MANVLRVDSDFDEFTRYATAFRDKVFLAPLTDPHHVVSHCGPQAVRLPVAAAMRSTRFDYVSASGHGMYSGFSGSDGAWVWQSREALTTFDGTIVHLLACRCGASLGWRMVQDGAVAFWGYSTDFQFLTERTSPPDLADDALAEIFFSVDLAIDIAILSGSSNPSTVDQVGRAMADAMTALEHVGLSATDKEHGRMFVAQNFATLVHPGATWGTGEATLG